jgi:hypothetical protein
MDPRLKRAVTSTISPDDLAIFNFANNEVNVSDLNVRTITTEDLPFYKVNNPALRSDETAAAIIEKLISRSVNTPQEIAWAVRRLHFLFLYLKRDRKIDAFVRVLINYFKDIPTFVSPDKLGGRSELAFGSVFWGMETAREFRDGAIEYKAVGNDEETLLSVIGLQYSMLKSISQMSDDEPVREWITSALTDIFMNNNKMRDQLELLYNDMKRTNIIRGNSVFVLLGIFLDSYKDSSTRYANTIIAYDACTKNIYVPWCRLR